MYDVTRGGDDRVRRMNMNAKTDYERYVTPEALATDQSLPAEQKLERLEDWAEDLNAGLRASGESMTGIDSGLTSALLQRVMACMEQLRAAQGRDLDR